MIYFSNFFLFFTVLFMQDFTYAAKVTDVVLEYINPKYIETKLLEVKPNRYNQTDNSIDLITRVLKDFPQDTKVAVKLYLVDSKNKKTKLLFNSRIPLCKDSEYYEYLPNFFKTIQSKTKCVKKGQYQIKNIKDFDYSNLVPDLDKKGQVFKLEFTIVSFWSGRILKGYNMIQSSNLNDNESIKIKYPQSDVEQQSNQQYIQQQLLHQQQQQQQQRQQQQLLQQQQQAKPYYYN